MFSNNRIINKNIKNTNTLGDVLDHVKKHKNKDDLIVFLDFDDTIINARNDKILEPEITKELINYLTTNGIYFSIITGRFYETVCNAEKRELIDMEYNVVETMHPILVELGIDVSTHQTDVFRKDFYEVTDEYGYCVGIVYMGIMFTPHKGPMIKNWMRHTGVKKGSVFFADDFEPYIISVASSLPDAIIFRRFPPHTKMH